MVAPNTTYPVRLAPSGPEIGSPPQQIGVGDGSGQSGRNWRFQGSGTTTQVPGTAAGDALGLAALEVDLLPGYKYDVSIVGFTFGTGGQYEGYLLGSNDGGLTYAVMLLPGPAIANANQPGVYVARKVDVQVAPTTHITHVTMQWKRAIAAGADLTYEPSQTSVEICEWSTSP